MTIRTDAQDHLGGTLPASAQASGRLPYEKPRVIFREPLEAVAAVCVPPNGKATPIDCFIGSS